MIEIVKLSQENHPEIFKLSQYAFQYHLTKEEYDKKCAEAMRHEIYGYKIDQQLAGKLHVIPLEVFIENKIFTMSGISSVATWPEHSGQKIAEKLIKKSLIESKEKQTMLAYLHPFNAGFYRRYGFEFITDKIDYLIPVEKLKQSWKKTGYVQRDGIQITDLNRVYEIFISHFNGGLKRDEKWWEQRVLTDHQAEKIIIKDEGDIPQAYLIYKLKNKQFEIIEMAYTNQVYLESLYHFILKHYATIKDVKMSTYEKNTLSYILDDPIFTQEKQPYFMARIVDLQAFLSKYPFFINNETCIEIFINDELLTENSGFYKMTAREITKSNEPYTENYLEINIGDLTALLMGYKNINELKYLNKIQGDEIELARLSSIINPKAPYLLDYF